MTISVQLAERSYEVHLNDGARHELAGIIAAKAPKAKTAVIVTSPDLEDQAWFDIETGITQHVLTVRDGELSKSFDSLASLLDQIAELELSRNDILVSVGGGAITDLTGFAAAVYLRGIGVIHIPTTVVGQVDAAIGGKTGININAGKNLVGAFHQPLAVLCDGETLTTLPEREVLGGLGEVAKCWLLEGLPANDIPSYSLHNFTEVAVSLKARIVSGDEREGGERALLNYGHTLGHALEKIALARDVDELRHGEAVAIGLAFAVRLAHALGRVGDEEVAYTDEVLALFELRSTMPENMPTDSLLEAMAHDKKAHHDLTFVLPGPKGFEVVGGVDPEVVRSVLEMFQGEK